MIKTFSFLLFILLTEFGYAQSSKQISIPEYEDGDTSILYKWNIRLEEKLSLNNLINSTDTFHFRFWTDRQVVDIWTGDYKIFFGQIINYTSSFEKTSKTFLSFVQLDTFTARETFELIETISEIPSEDSIKGWSLGLDGITYLLETSTPEFYSFKSYWTPTAQDSSLIEAKQIQTFVDAIYSALNLKAEYDNFFAALPPGSYTNDNFLIRTKLTDKQKKKWQRYKKRHPDS